MASHSPPNRLFALNSHARGILAWMGSRVCSSRPGGYFTALGPAFTPNRAFALSSHGSEFRIWGRVWRIPALDQSHVTDTVTSPTMAARRVTLTLGANAGQSRRFFASARTVGPNRRVLAGVWSTFFLFPYDWRRN